MSKISQSNLFAKECIETALISLAQEKPIPQISISELAERAGVSRVTFYRNYSTKEQIITDKLSRLFKEYALEDNQHFGGNYDDTTHVTHCLKFMYTNRFFLEGLIKCGYGSIFLDELTEYLLKKWLNDKHNYCEKYLIIAFSGRIYNTFNYWMKENYTLSPEELITLSIS